MWILGLNAYHGDAAACLIHEGKLIAAAEEERFRRIKHWAGFPSEAIRYCLKEGGIKLSDVHSIAINSHPQSNMLQRLAFTLRYRPNFNLLLDRLKNRQARLSIQDELNQFFPDDIFRGNIERVEHHLAHLASSFFTSPFEEALAVSVDGFGDFASSAWGIGQNKKLDIKARIFFPHSLGIFYQALTQFLGFPNYGDEYKVMGLAPYGKPRYIQEMRKIVRLKNNGLFDLNMRYFRFHREKINYTWTDGLPHVGTLFSDALTELLGQPRKKDEPLEEHHHDIARSIQDMYEEAFFHLLNHLYKKYSLTNVALAGGCAMNSVANGKITDQTLFKEAYIPAAAGDAGGAIGAALVAFTKLKTQHTPTQLHHSLAHAYCGPQFSNEQIEQIILQHKDKLTEKKCKITFLEDEKQLCEQTAQAISEGKVVGWFQGRMEWGPRALGNRSILCDARRANMKNILNLKIKRRESFRPFAPSILREAVLDWFETEDDVPYMMKVFKIRPEKRALIPAVTHVDGTGRLQTVHQETNPRYYCLIKTFAEKTNIPIILNTSFNENEPVVCQPEEALDCFLRTKMDVLVLGNWLIERE